MSRTSRLTLYAMLAVSLVLALGVAEAVFRAGYFRAYYLDDHGLDITFDREILFRFRPHGRADINNFGYRDRDFSPVRSQKQRAVVLGDSFVMGLHVPPEKTIPALLEEASGGLLEAYNMGVLSYGPDQSLIQIRDEVPAFNPDAVVLALYPTNDFNDMVVNRLFELDAMGRLAPTRENLVTANIPRLEVLYQLQFRLARLGLPWPGLIRVFRDLFGEGNTDRSFLAGMGSPEARYRYKLMKSILLSAKEALDARGVRFMVVIIPSIWSMEKTDELAAMDWPEAGRFVNEDVTARICAELGIESINLHTVFEAGPHDRPLYDHEDNHLSVYAHGLVANTVWAALVSPALP